MGYLPLIFRTIFKTTQKPTIPTIKDATAVNTVVAVVVMVDGSANVVWANADAAPMEVAATTTAPLLILLLISFILFFRLPHPLWCKPRAGNKRMGN